MVGISSVQKYLSTIQKLDRFEEKERIEVMKIVLPQLSIKKNLIDATPEELQKMEQSLAKAQQWYQDHSASQTEKPIQKPAPIQQKRVSRCPMLPPIWKMGLIAGGAALTWALFNSNVLILLGSLGTTLSRNNIRAMVQNPDALMQVQNLGHTLQNWNLVENGNFLHKKCGDCDGNPDATILSETAGMTYEMSPTGEKIWEASDESLSILLQSGRWSMDDYLQTTKGLLVRERHPFLEKAVDSGMIKGEYINTGNVDMTHDVKNDTEGFRILQKLFCTADSAKQLYAQREVQDPKIPLSKYGCSELIDSLIQQR